MAYYLIEGGKVKVIMFFSPHSQATVCFVNLTLFFGSSPCPALEEPAFFGILLPRSGDSGQYADAAHHPEIQRQPGRLS